MFDSDRFHKARLDAISAARDISRKLGSNVCDDLGHGEGDCCVGNVARTFDVPGPGAVRPVKIGVSHMVGELWAVQVGTVGGRAYKHVVPQIGGNEHQRAGVIELLVTEVLRQAAKPLKP